MFRHGRGSAVSRLAALPPGTYVRMHLGAVYVKARTRWMVAGVIGNPIGPKALLRLNRGHEPVVLVPAAGTRHGETW